MSEDTLRALRFMHDVESHTVCYLRDLLLTHAHQDPRVTTFLTMWNYEEYWHGVAIGRILEAHGEPAEDERIGADAARAWAGRTRSRPGTARSARRCMGPDFIAMHMTWGAINEWSTAAGYDRLAKRADHPVLTTLLGRIAKQESRHIAFYATEARERLARSRKAQKVTRFALHVRLGAGRQPGDAGRGDAVPPDATCSAASEGRELARRIDRQVAALPGMAGLEHRRDLADQARDPRPAADAAATARLASARARAAASPCRGRRAALWPGYRRFRAWGR